MAKTRNRIRSNDPVGLRNKLLDAAAGAFQQRGYEATSIHDLVRATGVTGGALHHHFPSKKSLALAVIDERVATEVVATWINRMAQAPNAARGIIDIFGAVAKALEAQGSVLGCPLGNMASELSTGGEEFRLALASHYANWRHAIASKVDEDQSAGRASYAAGDASAFADSVIALFTGALTIGKAEQSTSALHGAIRQLRVWMSADL